MDDSEKCRWEGILRFVWKDQTDESEVAPYTMFPADGRDEPETADMRQYWYTGKEKLILNDVLAGVEVSVVVPDHSVAAAASLRTKMAFEVKNSESNSVKITSASAGDFEVNYYDGAKDGTITKTGEKEAVTPPMWRCIPARQRKVRPSPPPSSISATASA